MKDWLDDDVSKKGKQGASEGGEQPAGQEDALEQLADPDISGQGESPSDSPAIPAEEPSGDAAIEADDVSAAEEDIPAEELSAEPFDSDGDGIYTDDAGDSVFVLEGERKSRKAPKPPKPPKENKKSFGRQKAASIPAIDESAAPEEYAGAAASEKAGGHPAENAFTQPADEDAATAGKAAEETASKNAKKAKFGRKKVTEAAAMAVAAAENEPPSYPAESALADEDSAAENIAADAAAAALVSDGGNGGKKKPPKQKKKWSGRKKVIVFGIIGLVVAVILGGLIYAYTIWNDPMSQFRNAQAAQMTAAPSETGTPSETAPGSDALDSEEPVEIPSVSVDPYADVLSQADLSVMNEKIIRVMLIGVDYAPERDDWSGKHAYHADVMIVLAINTETKQISLISLPRDTYSQIPGVKGIYKLNASLDCGGGWPKDTGFQKVCEAAQWMLGGQITVPYYYAVDMAAVKGLVDAIGGVDYNVDIDFTMMGRSYKAGMQHLTGQGVLDYFRVRKNIGDESGDWNRVARQKELLLAIFEKLKATGMLADLPKILDAFKEGGFYKNTTLSQDAALVSLVYKIGSENIHMYSMGGRYALMFNWSFCFTDQAERVKIIKEVFGVDVPQYSQFTYSAAASRWGGMLSGVVVSRSRSALSKVKARLDADAKLPEYGEPSPSPSPSKSPSPSPSKSPKPSVSKSPKPSASASKSPKPSPSKSTTASASKSPSASKSAKSSASKSATSSVTQTAAENFYTALLVASQTEILSSIPKGYRQYPANGTVWSLYRKCAGEVSSHNYNALMTDIPRLCSAVGVGSPSWRVNWEGSNEIDVDFR